MAQSQNIHTLFEPASAPVKGMRSAVSPAALPPGYFSQLTNVRFDELQLKVREGAYQITTNHPYDPHFPATMPDELKGIWVGSLQGKLTVVGAYVVGDLSVRLFNFDTGGYVWTEITHDGSVDARNGNTRFSPGFYVTFCVAKDQSGKEVLVAQNGYDFPRVYDPSAPTHEQVAIHQPITPTTVTTQTQAVLDWPATVPIASGSHSYSNSGADITMADTGTADTLATLVTVINGAAAGNYAQIQWTGGISFANSRQVIFAVNSTYQGLWANVKVQLVNTGTGNVTTVYDPTSTLNWPIYVTDIDPSDANSYCVAFSLDGLDLTQTSITGCNCVRLTWVGTSTPATTQTASIYMIAASGKVLGSCQYGVSWMNSQSRSESFGQFITATNTQSFQNLQGTPQNGLHIPNSELLYYRYTVSYVDVSSGEISNGTDTLNLYRMDAGETRYDLVTSITVNTFAAGAWSTANAGVTYTYVDTTATEDKNTARILPDALHQCIPVGTCMIASNGRLFVGGVPGVPTGYAPQADVWISGYNGMMRFRPSVKFLSPTSPDPTSPTVCTFPGEHVTNFTIVTGSLIGVNVVAIFTDRSVWQLNGFDAASLSAPSQVSRHGSPYPGSVANHLNSVYFVDEELQVRRSGGGQAQVISRNKIDNKIHIPSATGYSQQWAPIPQAAVNQERYYLQVLTPGTNKLNTILIYEELYGEWVEDYINVTDLAAILAIDLSPRRVLWAFSSNGLIFQLETPTQADDAGNPIPVTISSPELHDKMWNRITNGAVGIVTDIQSETLTVTRTWKNPTAGTDGTINLTNAPQDTAWLYETCTNNVQAGGTGLSVIIKITGNMVGGQQIYSLSTTLTSSGQSGANAG